MTAVVFTRDYPAGIMGLVVNQYCDRDNNMVVDVDTYIAGTLKGIGPGRCSRVVWKSGLKVLVDEGVEGTLVSCLQGKLWEVEVEGREKNLKVRSVRVRPQKIETGAYDNATVRAIVAQRRNHQRPEILDLLPGAQHLKRSGDFELNEKVLSLEIVRDFYHARILFFRANCLLLPCGWIGGPVIDDGLSQWCEYEECRQRNGDLDHEVVLMRFNMLTVFPCAE